MKLVIDSNRVMAALIKDSLTRKMILNDRFDFIAPDHIMTEILKHRGYLTDKSGMSDNEFDIVLLSLMDKVELIPSEVFEDKMIFAEDIMRDIDLKDSPFLALGMACNVDGIWSEDRDFDRQCVLKRYSTKELLDSLIEYHCL